jgi:hypothetical protein
MHDEPDVELDDEVGEALARMRRRADGMWPISRDRMLADLDLLERALSRTPDA